MTESEHMSLLTEKLQAEAATATAPKRALIVSGADRYADPWHPFAQTSARLAEILRSQNLTVEIAEDVDNDLAALTIDDPDLLVLNLGDPAHAGSSDPGAEQLAREGLLAYLARGRPLFISHVTLTSFGSVPEWAGIAGAMWVRGRSFHPPYGRARIHVHADSHPIVAGIDDFELDDERYTDLEVLPDVVPLASHEHEGREQPLIWARKHGTARVVYDALGHDAASYEAAPHREIVTRAAQWLLEEEGAK